MQSLNVFLIEFIYKIYIKFVMLNTFIPQKD